MRTDDGTMHQELLILTRKNKIRELRRLKKQTHGFTVVSRGHRSENNQAGQRPTDFVEDRVLFLHEVAYTEAGETANNPGRLAE